jgi:hypothetical protein
MLLYKEQPTFVHPLVISGKQGSGKTTTAQLVQDMLVEQGFSVMPYKMARTIYEMHDAILEIMRRQGIKTPDKDGRLLQLLGTDWGRTVYGEDVWIRCALADYEKLVEHNPVQGPFKVDYAFLIDDIRFKNELAAFEFGLKVRLECPREVRKARCPAWRETDTHPSEVDLDDSLGMFNLVLDTENTPIEAVAQMIVQAFKDKFMGVAI